MQFKWLFAAIALGAGAAQAQMPPAAPTPPALSGEWVVDLSSEPGKPYTRPMVLVLAANGVATASSARPVLDGSKALGGSGSAKFSRSARW